MEVAAFFRVSVRTVFNWTSSKPPLLSFWRQGRNVCFGEESIVNLRVKFLNLSQRLPAGEAQALARREWRQFIEVRGGWQELEKRVAALENDSARPPLQKG